MTSPTFQDVVIAIEAMADAMNDTQLADTRSQPTGVELAWVAVQALDAAGYHICPAPPPVPAPGPNLDQIRTSLRVTGPGPFKARSGRVTLEGDTRPNQPDPDPAPTGDAA